MRLNMKGITEMATTAAKMCRAAYDTGVTWEKIAIDACTRYLMEEQRAELYASANAALYDKLTALQSDPSDSAAARSFRLTQDQLRPGDPRRDFPGGVPHTINSSAARTAATALTTAGESVYQRTYKRRVDHTSLTPWTFRMSAVEGEWSLQNSLGITVGRANDPETAQSICDLVNAVRAAAYDPAQTRRTSSETPSVSNTPKEAKNRFTATAENLVARTPFADFPTQSPKDSLSFPPFRAGPTTTAVFDGHPGHRAAQGQAGRRTEPTLDADWPGTIAD
jgi:hypothetical protein